MNMETIYRNASIWIEFDIKCLSKKLKVPTSNVSFDQETDQFFKKFYKRIDSMPKGNDWNDTKEIIREKIRWNKDFIIS